MQPARPHDYFGLTVPFLDHIGLEPVHFGEGKAGTRLPLRHPITNSRGEVQGGGDAGQRTHAAARPVRQGRGGRGFTADDDHMLAPA